VNRLWFLALSVVYLLTMQMTVGAQSEKKISASTYRNLLRSADLTRQQLNAPTLIPVDAHVDETCKALETLNRKTAGKSAAGIPDAQTLQMCMDQLSDRIELAVMPTAAANAGMAPLTEDKIHEALMSQYLAYRNLKQWYTDAEANYRTQGTSSDFHAFASLAASYSQLRDRITAQMQLHGLALPFSAQLVTGASMFQTSGAVPNAPGGQQGNVQSSSTASSVSPSAFVAWDSRHWGAEDGRRGEVSLTGKFGFIPSLTLVQPLATATNAPAATTTTSTSTVAVAAPSSTATPQTSLTAAYQEAFVWSTGTKMHIRAGDNGETSIRASVGQSILTTNTSVVDQGPNSYISIPVTNGTGQAEAFWEVGGDLNIYSQGLEMVHVSKTELNPLFHIEGGFRHDNRFKQDGPLVGFAAPTNRYFFRFMLGNIPITSSDSTGIHTFSLSFGLEREGPWHNTSAAPEVPAGTRIIIKGDLNILKLIRPDQPVSNQS
jgi:hypothetical protein